MYYKKVIGSFLFILLFLSTIVNYDTKADLIGEIHTSEQIILAYNAVDVPVPEEKYFHIKINHYDMENGNTILPTEILENIEVGSSLNSRNYMKKITNYEFNKIHPETLIVDENNRTINIYYKYIGEQVQEPDEDLEQNSDDENLPNEDNENTDKDNDNVHEDNGGDEDIEYNKDNDVSTNEDGTNNPDISATEQSTSNIPQTGLPVNLIQLGYIVLLAGIILFKE